MRLCVAGNGYRSRVAPLRRTLAALYQKLGLSATTLERVFVHKQSLRKIVDTMP
jgi:hypothetical protein